MFWLVGRKLVDSSDAADRDAGVKLLRRAAAATPEHPKLHVWAGTPPSIGFPHADAVARAKALLADLDKH